MEDSKYLIDSEPGVCSQSEFNHDFCMLLDEIRNKDQKTALRAYVLVKLAVEKGYKIPW